MAPSFLAKLRKAHNEGGIRKKAWAKLKSLVGKSKKLTPEDIALMEKNANDREKMCGKYNQLHTIFMNLAQLSIDLQSAKTDYNKMDASLEKYKRFLTSKLHGSSISFDKKETSPKNTIPNLLKAVDLKNINELEKMLGDAVEACRILSGLSRDIANDYRTLVKSGVQNAEISGSIDKNERLLNETNADRFAGKDGQYGQYSIDYGVLAKNVIASLYSANPKNAKIPEIFIIN